MKYWQLLKISTAENIAYRARLFLWFILDTAIVFAFPFIWLAIYGDREVIAGFTKIDIVMYYVVIALVSTLATSHASEGIKDEIMQGQLSSLIIRPINYIFYKTVDELSYRIMYTVIVAPLALVVGIIYLHAIVYPATLLQWLFFTLSLILSFSLSHSIQLAIGFCVFWIGETSALQHVRQTMEKIFSGEIAPLVFFPPLLGSIAFILPFKYLSYFPAQIFLNQIGVKEILLNCAIAIAWIAGVNIITLILWKRGIRRYEGVGI